ncbi:MAG TPA: S8 family serine peptidase [Acidimicrobiia bacterium]|nr:S8 family serine peptidase [Acidimicrobiia bacterium]
MGAALALVTLSFAAMPAAHAAVSDAPTEAVIVEASSVSAASSAVAAVGGNVDLALPIVAGVAAHVGPAGIAALETNPALRVLPDVALHPTSGSFRAADATSVDTQISAMNPPAGWSPDAGRGVAVALVDTGVTATPDLHGNRLVQGPDLSGEGDGIDHYGHGTFMAGLIAGDGTASAGAPTRHFGVAPAATVVSVKVAGADGSTSVSRVLAGIGWVVTHRDAFGIDVLNLSFGVDAPMPYVFNPLSAAVEAAWASGITVVVSAGNDGNGHVTSPGSDPYVITVGAADTAGTRSTGDDAVPAWSGRERFRNFTKPDVVAPGVSVISLRAPGSTVDVTHPEGRVGSAYFRGTGTSMSTALVSGGAAVLLSHHPAATPDDVKGALVDGAARITGGREVDLARADTADAQPDWWQHYTVAFNGLDRDLEDGMPWTSSRWTSSRWTSSRWTTTRWTMTRWTDAEWQSSRWTSSRWTSTSWTSSRWTAEAWPSQSWG